ncbi:CU044_5270 family protein [Micromonosporaceae bacterium Da 78-11]
MNDQPDVMRQLAGARPAYFDRPGDPHRRQADLQRILAQSRTATDQQKPSNIGPRQPASGPRPLLTRVFSPARSGTRRRVVSLSAAAGLTAIALVAAGAVAASHSAGDPTASTAAPPPDRSQALLLAAQQVSTAPDTGRYWRTTTESHDLELGSTAKGPFRLTYNSADESWVARSDTSPSWAVTRPWSRVPADSEDRSNWKNAGSPATFDLHYLDRNGEPAIMTGIRATGGKTVVDPMNADSEAFSIGGLAKSMSDIRRLPAQPETLTTALLENYQRSIDAAAAHGRSQPGGNSPTKQAWLFSAATEILTLPVTPQVRATAYRIMASLDGVNNLGQASDVEGRTGNAVALQFNGAVGLQEDRLIIDATTGMLLAQETRLLTPTPAMSWVKPTDIYSTSVITGIGWTNDTPPARTTYTPSGKGIG